MNARRQEDGWTLLELIGSYAAGEMLFNRSDHRHLAECYARMLVMLSTLSEEPVEAPEVIVSYAVRRAYLSAFLRQAEQVVRGLVGDYVGALTFYLGLRPAWQ
jgi:hypothetical protein